MEKFLNPEYQKALKLLNSDIKTTISIYSTDIKNPFLELKRKQFLNFYEHHIRYAQNENDFKDYTNKLNNIENTIQLIYKPKYDAQTYFKYFNKFYEFSGSSNIERIGIVSRQDKIPTIEQIKKENYNRYGNFPFTIFTNHNNPSKCMYFHKFQATTYTLFSLSEGHLQKNIIIYSDCMTEAMDILIDFVKSGEDDE
jgi:hypothetical protein